MHSHPNTPTRGSASPWGTIDDVEPYGEGLVFVGTASHGGLWLSPQREAQIPADIQPMHGRSWLEEDCEVALAFVLFEDIKRRDSVLGDALHTLAAFYPTWLDRIAARAKVPTTRQVTIIKDAWKASGMKGSPDLATFKPDPTVEGIFIGQIGSTVLVVGRDAARPLDAR